MAAATRAFQLGDRVTVAQTQLCGTAKFIGTTEFAAGEWMGIELDDKAGKNNGCVKGKAYFECKPDHGLFVRPTAVTKIGPSRRRSDFVPSASMQPPRASIPASPPSPAKNPFLAAPQSPIAGRRTSSRQEEGERSREIQKASVQLDLAQAMEDHDVDALEAVLPVASNLGLPPEEIAAAKRILSWELKQTMREEVDAVQATISQLSQSLACLEALAAKQPNTDPSAILSRLGQEL
ncbi:CLIP1, partial [Symbiodinium pilosum]